MRRFVIFGAVIAAVVLIWSAGWLYISNEIRTQVTILGTTDGYAAPKVTCGTLDIGGYPFRFNLACANATIVSGDLTFALPRIEAATLVFQPTLFHMRAVGPMTAEDAFLGGKNRIDWTNLEGSLRLTDWRIGRLSILADTVAWSDTLVTETLIARTPHLELHLADIPGQHDDAAGLASLAGWLQADSLTFPAWAVNDGFITAAVELSKLPDDLRAISADPIRDWQAAGGRIALTEIKGFEGDDTVTITGDLGLTDAGLAEGTIEIASKGIVERSEGLVAPEMQPLIFGAAGDDGTYRQRLTIANGVIFVGMLPAFGIPPLF
jgi:hypothetical protein